MQTEGFELSTNKVWVGMSGCGPCQGLTEKQALRTTPVHYENSAGLFVLMLSTPVLANNLKRLGFKTDSGLYFVHFVGDTSLLVFWR